MINFIPTILISLPIIGAFFVSTMVFDLSAVPDTYFSLAIFLFIICTVIFLIDYKIYKKSPVAIQSLSSYRLTSFQTAFIKYFVLMVIMFCFLDLYYHGIVFYNYIPGLYMIFDSTQRRIRHISSMVWTFATVSFFVSSKWIKFILLACAVVFPILFVDRGRLQFTLLSIIFVYIFFFRITFKKIALIFAIFLLAGSLFSFLGKDRSGAGDGQLMGAMGEGKNINPTHCEMPALLPFSDFFRHAPIRTQWLMVYIGIPFYNLQTQLDCNYRDSSVLKGQLIPFWRLNNTIQQWPLVSAQLNVATEFLPFALIGGYFGIFIAIAIMWTVLMLSISCFKKFSKLSTSLIFSMFSSLFFTWSNFAFLILFFSIKMAEKNRHINSFVCAVDRKLSFKFK
jgi:hypothetical protein